MGTKSVTKFTKTLIAAAAIAAIVLSSAAEARQGRVVARGQNGAVAAGAGPNGGAYARGHGAVQNADGSVTVPEVLRPYMGGVERLTPAA